MMPDKDRMDFDFWQKTSKNGPQNRQNRVFGDIDGCSITIFDQKSWKLIKIWHPKSGLETSDGQKSKVN